MAAGDQGAMSMAADGQGGNVYGNGQSAVVNLPWEQSIPGPSIQREQHLPGFRDLPFVQ